MFCSEEARKYRGRRGAKRQRVNDRVSFSSPLKAIQFEGLKQIAVVSVFWYFVCDHLVYEVSLDRF